MMSIKKGLGKGFGSLIPSDFDESILMDKKDRVQKLLISDIKPDPKQPRKSFDEQQLSELAQSIKRFGMLQPIVVRPHDDLFIIVAGERRHRAAQKAGLSYVPALVRTLEELERLEIGLVENVQRVDLSPLEQAMSIARLNTEFNISMQEIAKRLGKAHTTIVNILRLLQLPEFAREALAGGVISEGHARTILALKNDEAKQKELLRKIDNNKWSVRQAEQFVTNAKESPKRGGETSKRYVLNNDQKELLRKIETKSKTKADVIKKSKGGQLRLGFKTSQELEIILKKLAD